MRRDKKDLSLDKSYIYSTSNHGENYGRHGEETDIRREAEVQTPWLRQRKASLNLITF